MHKKPETYLKHLEYLQTEFDEKVTALADEIRDNWIVPVCKKHKLEFMSGNGRFFFFDKKGNDYEDPFFIQNKKLKEVLTPILDLLSEEVSSNQCLGYYVAGYSSV